MLSEPVSFGQAASLGGAIVQRFRRKVRLRVEPIAHTTTHVSHPTGEKTHGLKIDVRMFNIGQAVTVRLNR